MADLSEIMTYLAVKSADAVYPNGTGSPSVAGVDCRVYEGWPNPDQLDRDMSGQMFSGTPARVTTRPGGAVANISVYPMPGTGIVVHQLLNQTKVITPPTYGLSVMVAANTIVVTGQPVAGEYLTLLCDGNIILSKSGATTADILTALAAEAETHYPSGVTLDGSMLTIPVTHGLVVRQGGKAVMGRTTHRQRHPVMITVWAPTHTIRASLSDAIDNKLKQNLVFSLSDTSQALLVYNRTHMHDEKQTATIYRRDLIYDVEYATVEKFDGYVVTSANVTITNPDETAMANAITSGVTQAGEASADLFSGGQAAPPGSSWNFVTDGSYILTDGTTGLPIVDLTTP